MGTGSKFIAFLFSYTLIWGSYELYHQMRIEDFMSLGAIGYAALSVACVGLATLVAKAAVDS
jgi:TRAP-type C4-dicarboxylate transport system permease small subunit